MRRSLETIAVCSALSIFTFSCGEQPTNPSPDVPAPLQEIVDAAHGGGNQDFFFLPPLVPDPSGDPAYDADAFDASLAPVVEICALEAGDCAATQPDLFPITYTMDTGPGSETIRADTGAEHYIVNWHTDAFALDPAVTYRIRVLVAGTELGHADVDVVESGKELKNVNTGEYVALKDGRTLPVKFRIEQGAVFVVGTGGGTVAAEDGAVTLVVPERDSPIGITVRPATGYPDTADLVAGTAFDLGPDGTTFDPPAMLTLRYDPQNLPPNTVPRLHHLVDGEWTRVPGATADLAAHTVTGPVTGFSPWAVLGTGPVLTVHVAGGQGQVVVQGSALDPCRYDGTLPCAADFTLNQNLTLEAQPLGSDARFEGWSGSVPATCATDPLCSITMDQDRDVTATFSMPGLVGLSTYTTALTATQGATGASAQIVVSNIGGRDLHLEPVQVYNDEEVPHWLDASITDQTVTTASPETLTVSVAANPLPPGTYGAHVLVTDGYFSGVLAVTLTVSSATSYTYDGTGNQFGPRPLSIAIFTNSAGTDIYPVGTGEQYLFVLFDTGSSIVYLGSADATFLNIGAASPTNPNQDTRVRLDGLSAIDPDPTSLAAPIGAHGTPGGAQAEVTGIRVGPASPPQRPDLNASLIGAPVANGVLALIDNTTTITRGPYAVCGGCSASGPDITFYMPGDAGIPTPDLELPMVRFGSTSPALLDNATNGQKYFLNQVLFRNGAQAVMHDPAASQPFRFWFDTGAPETIIDTRLATALGIDLTAAGSFDCFQGVGKAGNEGYVIDQIAFTGATASGVGAYVVNHAEVCVDIRSEELRQYYTPSGSATPVLVDAQIGANLFMYVPILFDGPGNTLGVVVP